MYYLSEQIKQEYATEFSKLNKLEQGKMNKILDKLVRYRRNQYKNPVDNFQKNELKIGTYREMIKENLKDGASLEIVFQLDYKEINRLEKKLDNALFNRLSFEEINLLTSEFEKAKNNKIKKYILLHKSQSQTELTKLEFLKIVQELI